MKMMTKRSWIVLAAVLLFAACKGESPTAPSGGNTGGGTPPPVGVNVTLTASNATPIVDSTSIITANVTNNGAPVPNGTAVEFSTTNGTFTDTAASSTIRTTTNGVATATLTSSVAGAATVTAVVNNVSRTIGVTFRERPVEPPPTSNTPTITSVEPNIGRPSGGQVITIHGSHFTAPVRVLFDVGAAQPLEGFVSAVTDTTITVTTPPVDLGAGQQKEATIKVITQAGTASEQSATAPTPFIFRNESLTPVIYTLTPNSGPIDGGTRVTIVGEGFQAPVQVLFGSAEARVVDVQFSQIIVEAPAGRDTNPDGSGTVTGPVDVTVVNVFSNTRNVSTAAFRYTNKMQITGIRPITGSALGGTDVTIDGTGFVAPIDVTIGGVRATVLRVSGSQVLVRTNALPSPCAEGGGVVVVSNINNGDSDIWGDQTPIEQPFDYIAVEPLITAVAPATGVSPGTSVTATVANPGIGPLGMANIRFKVNGTDVIPSPSSITDGTTTTNFTVPTPTSGYTFPTQACTIGTAVGIQQLPLDAPITFNNTTTGCSDTATVRILPPTQACIVPPQAAVTNPSAGCLTYANTPVSTQAQQLITFQNVAPAGAQNLNVSFSGLSGTDAAMFTVTPTTIGPIAGGANASFTATFLGSATPAATYNATATFTTNDPNNPTVTVCLTGQTAP